MPEPVHLVVVAGAGASTHLGPTDGAVPLMSGWFDRVESALNAAEAGLAKALGITRGLPTDQLEEIIGSFLQFRSNIPLAERFLATGGHPVGTLSAEMNTWVDRARARSDRVVEVMRSTLYEAFGAEAIDESRATSAYKQLLAEAIPGGRPTGPSTLAFATTNYDPAIEIALRGMRVPYTVGEITDGIHTAHLHPDGIVNESGTIPILHLHGAVGWYRRNNRVEIHPSDQRYNPTLGDEPALLMPDPNKDPSRDAGVMALWNEFTKALDRATHILVIGHSLHDPTLVAEVRKAIERGARGGVTTHVPEDSITVGENLPGARQIQTTLGPDFEIDREQLVTWRGWD